MASESIVHSAFSLMGYWLRAHSGLRNNNVNNIRTPPPPGPLVEDLPFLLTPEDQLKLHSPLKASKKYGLTPKEYGFTPEEVCENKASPPKTFIVFYSTPKEILNFYNLSLENSMVPQKGECGY